MSAIFTLKKRKPALFFLSLSKSESMDIKPNSMFSLAADIVANTSLSVFLTGKAGSGKTTFLHQIKDSVDKNVVVAAPTGVAAINAGGVTLHSLLQLPFEPFTPDMEGRKKLDYHSKFRKSKIELIRELELLIIDEVSMLRADMLDAIDYVLRKYRNNSQPFGGVQMLFIGDLFQLPPVVQNEEWKILSKYYASPFFFHAQALNGNMPIYIELKTIYRQSDEQFIGILNRIRNNRASEADLQTLNAKYDPLFRSLEDDQYITLCTHNYKADQINKTELERLPGKSYSFSGDVKGNFSESLYPTDLELNLKVGAQIMFVKNDSGENRRYYNGKLGKVVALSEKGISVEFKNGSILEVEKEIWRNIRYVLNPESNEIEEEELGYFSQYPIRLAWAITIHKSQGLTFDKVIIDAGQAFAAGQVYVALSRCTTLNGIVLYSKITPSSIQTDREAIEFSKEEKPVEELEAILRREKPNYTAQRLKMAFDWSQLIYLTRSFYELVQEKKIPKQEEALGLAAMLCNRAIEQEEVTKSFIKELDHILYYQQNFQVLKDRVQKASQYFHNDILEHIARPLATHLDELKHASRVKIYLKKAKEIFAGIEAFMDKLQNIHYGNIKLTEDTSYRILQISEEIKTEETKAQKGDSKKISLALFREGRSVKEIAQERNLSVQTIENHLIDFVRTGELQANQVISQETIDSLTPMMKEYTLDSALKPIKESLPEHFSYFEIKVMLNHLNKE